MSFTQQLTQWSRCLEAVVNKMSVSTTPAVQELQFGHCTRVLQSFETLEKIFCYVKLD